MYDMPLDGAPDVDIDINNKATVQVAIIEKLFVYQLSDLTINEHRPPKYYYFAGLLAQSGSTYTVLYCVLFRKYLFQLLTSMSRNVRTSCSSARDSMALCLCYTW